MVDVDGHHLGGASGRATGLDRAGRPIADLEEAHQARRSAAAAQRLALAAQAGEVRTGARAVLEQPGFADPKVHDPVFIHQVVADRLDETRVRLRVFVSRGRLGQLAGLEVDVVVALAGSVDPVGPVEAGVEPLRRVGCGHLAGQHKAHLVVVGAGVLFLVEVAAFPAPIGPSSGQAVEDLLRRSLATLGPRPLAVFAGFSIRRGTPEPSRDSVLLDPFQLGRNAALAEVLLRQDVAGDLAPVGRHLDVRLLKHHRAVGVADFARRFAESDRLVDIFALLGEVSPDPHVAPLFICFACAGDRSRQESTRKFGAISAQNRTQIGIQGRSRDEGEGNHKIWGVSPDFVVSAAYIRNNP